MPQPVVSMRFTDVPDGTCAFVVEAQSEGRTGRVEMTLDQAEAMATLIQAAARTIRAAGKQE